MQLNYSLSPCRCRLAAVLSWQCRGLGGLAGCAAPAGGVGREPFGWPRAGHRHALQRGVGQVKEVTVKKQNQGKAMPSRACGSLASCPVLPSLILCSSKSLCLEAARFLGTRVWGCPQVWAPGGSLEAFLELQRGLQGHRTLARVPSCAPERARAGPVGFTACVAWKPQVFPLPRLWFQRPECSGCEQPA